MASTIPPSHPGADAPGFPLTTYLPSGGDALAAEPLDGDVKADLAIVGGGICGCSLALHAAEAGLGVVLVEANAIGWGASGRNSGHLPAASKHSPQEMMAMYGPERGQRLNALIARGPSIVFDLATRHGMDASIERTGTLNAAHTPAALRKMEAQATFWARRQHPVELLDKAAAAKAIGSDFYVGALLDRRGGTINPLAYVRGLARAARDAGAVIFERSRATSLRNENGAWRVATRTGSIRARAVALCTNAYTDGLWPGLEQSIVPVRLQQYVSKPLPEPLRARILPGRPAFTDSRRMIIGVRVHPDGRFQFNGRGPGFGAEDDLAWPSALARMTEIWPELDGIEQQSAWTGWVAMNRERAWKVHNPAPGLYAALGCNGRGIVIATLIGRELARHLSGASVEDTTLPMADLKPIPLHAIHRPIVRTIVGYFKLRDTIELRTMSRYRPDTTTMSPARSE